MSGKSRTVKPRFSIVCALLILAGSMSARGQVAPNPIDGAIETLKPGEFLWAPDIAPDGPITLIVSLKSQRAFVYRNGLPIGASTISSGRPGHATPTGIFTILQMAKDHKSNLYNDAPMPFMQRLTWGGIALHAGNLPGYPASHGCIRLPPAFAQLLYGVTRLGLTVVITNDAVAPEVVPTQGVLGTFEEGARVEQSGYTWAPAKSRSGPISIIVSGRDRRMVVLLNGVEIGSTRVVIDGSVEATEAFTLRSIDGSKLHWLRLPLPGHVSSEASEMTVSERGRLHLPEEFRRALLDSLTPGTTLLVTRDTLRSSGTGRALTVITTDTN